jgi:hypothetical protein
MKEGKTMKVGEGTKVKERRMKKGEGRKLEEGR